MTSQLPPLPRTPDLTLLAERLNVLIQQYNLTARVQTTVAALPAAALFKGGSAFVTDATVTTFASVVAGGGVNLVPVYSDGTNWRIG